MAKQSKGPVSEKWIAQCRTSIEEKSRRQHCRFRFNYDSHLPIIARRAEIVESIKKHQVIILSGETGSGKTTQIPKFCLEAGRGVEGKIACTQPRRIAALSVADRIAEELEDTLSVGVKIRFQDNDHPKSFIKLMTDGVLLAETQSDPWLNQYDTIIIDEAHERSLNIDFILGILKRLIQRRKDLKLIITSATIDTEKFSKAFGNAPVIEVSGRTYPVEVRYRPSDDEEQSLAEQSWDAIEEILTESSRGDMLVFMPTEQDIREAIEIGPARLGRQQALLLPLYARLASKDQKRIFQSASERKIIFSTNIAETSLTIPGIRFVVDTGLARLARYSPGTGTFGLPVEPVSQSSADQRKGRCGRIEEGICIRLYSEEDYQGRSIYTSPEILRTNLAEVILRMLNLRIHDVDGFPFIDKPSSAGINDGFKTLIELCAIQKKGKGKKASYQLTAMGREMAKVPADPRLTRMLLQSELEGCTKEALVLMGALSIHDPRERPKEKAGKAAEVQSVFNDSQSDFLTYLNIWKGWENTSGSLMKRIKSFSKEYFLSFRRMKEWVDLYQQFRQLARERKMDIKDFQGNKEALHSALHRSILSGFLSHTSRKKDAYAYEATRNRKAFIFPGSQLFKEGPLWLVSAEIVRTSKLFLRINGQIDPQWLLDLGSHLLSYRYHEPHWDEEKQEVVAREEVWIYNFLIKNDDWVPYGQVAPREARDIFIKQGLMEGMKHNAPSFLQKNRSLRNDILKVENKLRKRGFYNEEAEELHYQESIPQVASLSELQLWIKKEGDKALLLSKEDLLTEDPDKKEIEMLPDYLKQGEQRFKIRYRFKPGDKLDGATVIIPKKEIENLNPDEIDDSIPGLQREQISAYLKQQPKSIRKQLIPMNQHVDCILKEWEWQDDDTLESALSRFLYQKWNLDVPVSSLNRDALPPHIQLKFAVVDKRGRILKSTNQAQELKEKKQWALEQHVLDQWNRQEKKIIKGLEEFNLPIDTTRRYKGKEITLYPSLIIEENQLWTYWFQTREEAEESLSHGVAKLVGMYYSKEIKSFKKECSIQDYQRYLIHFEDSSEWINQLWDRALFELFGQPLRKKKDVQNLIQTRGMLLYEKGMHWFHLLQNALEAYILWRSYIQGIKPVKVKHLQEFIENREKDAESLFSLNFLKIKSREEIEDMPRTLRCLQARTVKGLLDISQDKAREDEWLLFYNKLKYLELNLPEMTSNSKKMAIDNFKKALKEYYVSLFCQQEKRKIKVSPKRLNDMLSEIKRMA